LFGMLAILQPRALSRSRAAETLWSRRPSDQARASLRQELHRLLDGFGPLAAHVLSIGRDQMQLNPDTCWVDIIALQQASLENPQPLELLDGVLLDGLTGIDPSLDSWIIAERERLNDWARTLADRILQAQGEPAGQIAAANRLLGIDRAHEGAWRSLMQAYAVSGDSAMALKAYERCRASLADLLGRTPSADTEQLCGVIRGDLAATSVPASSIYTADGDDEPAGRRDGPAMPKLAAPRSHPADGHAGKKAGVSGLMFGATAVQADHPARPPVTFARSPGNPLRLGIVRLDAAGATPMETRLALGSQATRCSISNSASTCCWKAPSYPSMIGACGSNCSCWICAAAARWPGHAGSSRLPTTSLQRRTRSPRWRRHRSTLRSKASKHGAA
jgi:DNA-binding SARP family transcriptional activator